MRKLLYLLTILALIPNLHAKNCTGKMFNPVTDVCWDCIFPISIGKTKTNSKHKRHDTKNPSNITCVCPGKIIGLPQVGIAIGFWEAIRLVDVTTRPFCMTNLGGEEIMPENFTLQQNGVDDNDQGAATYHLHWYISPINVILGVLMDILCIELATIGLDIAYMTEFDPLFHNDLLSFIINPEAILFANPIAQAACIADSIAATLNKPLDYLFWCAGSQGHLYPFTGNVNGVVSSIQATSLITEKFIAKLHRQMMLPVTSGPKALCMPYPLPIIKKSQYRLQTTFPKVGMNKYACNPIGKATILHEKFKKIPYKGEDFGYLIWRKRNCCLL